MTNKFKNWERIEEILNRHKLTINSFASKLGFARSENLYHIRKGNYGISEELANRIIEFDPEIDRTWLLSGIGNMLKSQPSANSSIPFYCETMEEVLPALENIEPSSHISIPYATGSDFVIRSLSRPMSDSVTTANDLFLKRLSGIHEVVQGNEHVLLVNNEVIWRKVRYVRGNPDKWRLVSRNRDEFPDIIINASDVSKVWRVIARIAILES
jgi:hypothetical protein